MKNIFFKPELSLKKYFPKNVFVLINPIFVVSTFRVKYAQNIRMEHELKKEGRYKYFEAGEGTPIIILHGLMGGLSNFDGVVAITITSKRKQKRFFTTRKLPLKKL